MRVCDDDECVETDFQVVVNNVAPALQPAQDQTEDEYHEFRNLVVATFTDPGSLDSHGAAAHAPGTAVDWGDTHEQPVPQGFTADDMEVLEQEGDGQVRATHRYLQNGVYTVRVRVCDE